MGYYLELEGWDVAQANLLWDEVFIGRAPYLEWAEPLQGGDEEEEDLRSGHLCTQAHPLSRGHRYRVRTSCIPGPSQDGPPSLPGSDLGQRA